MGYDAVLFEKNARTHVAYLTFNRPDKLNAIDAQMSADILAAIREVEQDDDIKTVLIRGAGRAFCVGRDLGEVGNLWKSGDGRSEKKRASQRRRLIVDNEAMVHYPAIFYCMKATVTAVKGYALAGGFDFCMASDLQIVAKDAVFGEPAERLVGPGLENNTLLYFWKLGPTLAKDLLMTGKTMTGEELDRYNVFTRVVSADEVDEQAEELALKVSKMPADGIVMGKAAFNLVSDMMGIGMGYRFGKMWHSFQTNLMLEEDEFNFFKARRDHGVTDAMKMMREHFDGPEESAKR